VLGHDTMKEAMTNYFQKYQWKNTELADFVGALKEAYDKQPQKIMGKDFDFKKWCDSWLLSSGVNILQPIAKYGPDESI